MKKLQKAGIVMLSAGVLGGVAPAVVPSVLNLNGSVVYAEENIVDLHYRFEGKDDLINVKVNIAENPNATVGDYYPLSKDGADLKYITKGKGMMWVYKVDPDHNYRVDHRGDLLSKYAHLHLLGVYTQPNNAGTEVKPNNDGNVNASANNNEKTHKVTIYYNLYDDPMSPFSSSSSSKVFYVTPNQPLSDHIPETLPGGYVFAGAIVNRGGSEGTSLDSRNALFGDWTNFYVTYPKSKRSGANNNAGTEVKPNNDGNANAGANNNAGTEVKPNNDGNANAGANNNAGTNAGTKALINNVPELGNVDKLKIEAEIEQLKEQIKDGEENGAESYYIEGLKARLADLEEALKILAANKPAVNEVPEYKLPVASAAPAQGSATAGTRQDNTYQAPATKEESKKELPKTGTKENAALASVGFLGLVLGSLPFAKRKN
ncbi:LPXTG cell wall anchor domain-containing protein [uncultured Streptococcus sp.]|uniref:LPXTG cell wall anchor domain-containing protein n=1 Tax=uncultured Streptococcus sp. TaxID=83427 RepID=UPI001A39AE60|nr:LPXTG cell wall anchor domain-containing protein [uncultured Streptococcus sp.]VTY14310.1 Uncharacterised protein [uncultured Streptococcus sp.]